MKHLSPEKIYNAECIAGMTKMLPEQVDLIITDPPFGIDFKARMNTYNRNHKKVLTGYHEVAKNTYGKFTKDWMTQAYRLLKPSGACFIFSGWNNLKEILISSDECGFEVVNHIIWKFQFGVVCQKKFVSSHYHCLYLCKDAAQRKFFNSARFGAASKTPTGGSARYQDLEDVWQIKREYWKNKVKTPTKLPRELIEKILAYTSEPDDLIFDPFLGSGQVAVIARLNNRRAGGFEIAKDYYDFIKKRLAAKTYLLPD